MFSPSVDRALTPPARQNVIEGFGQEQDEEDLELFEGQCYLKTKEEHMKKHWMVIIGNELYFYRKKGEGKHKVMHCLTGTYLKEVAEDGNSEKQSNSEFSTSKSKSSKRSNRNYYPIKIVIPPSKSRLVFFTTPDE